MTGVIQGYNLGIVEKNMEDTIAYRWRCRYDTPAIVEKHRPFQKAPARRTMLH